MRCESVGLASLAPTLRVADDQPILRRVRRPFTKPSSIVAPQVAGLHAAIHGDALATTWAIASTKALAGPGRRSLHRAANVLIVIPISAHALHFLERETGRLLVAGGYWSTRSRPSRWAVGSPLSVTTRSAVGADTRRATAGELEAGVDVREVLWHELRRTFSGTRMKTRPSKMSPALVMSSDRSVSGVA